MAEGRTTQVQIPFADADSQSIAGDTFVFEQSSRTANPGEAYVRLHPGSTGIAVSSTSGSFTKSQTGLYKRVESYETFSDVFEVVLRYPEPKNVVMELVGRFLTSEGTPATPTFTYDAARRTIRSTVKGYGVIKVRYDAPYDLWKAKFIKKASGGARIINPYSELVMTRDGLGFYAGFGTPDNDDDPAITGYLPMTVIGRKDKEVHTFSPSPTPDSDGNTYGAYSATGTQMPRLRLEQDPNFPPRLTKGAGVNGAVLAASCGIRLYPNVAPSMTVTAGVLRPGTEYDSVVVKDSLSFNGSASSSLQYQPAGSVSVSVSSGSFFDKWGRRFNPDVRVPGESYTAVTWVSSTTYGNPISRTVNEDEVIICDSFGNSIPCYGVLELGYTTSYRTYTYVYEYDSTRKQFKTAFIAALAGGQFASLQVQPPSLRGVA